MELVTKDTFKLDYKGESYYHNPLISLEEIMQSQIDGKIKTFSYGIDNQFLNKIFFTADIKTFHKKTKIGTAFKYPELFNLFWNNYHKERRMNKRKTFEHWFKLSAEEKDLIIIAAKNYTNHINTTSSASYMKYPERFIKDRMFEDMVEEDSSIIDTNHFMEYFNFLFKSKVGHAYSFNSHEKIMIREDVKNIPTAKIKDLCYIFFNKLDSKVVTANRNEEYSYRVFSSLAKGVLGITKAKATKPCEYCGLRGGHTQSCPTQTEKSLKAATEEKQLEEERDENINIMQMFKNNIKKRSN